MALLSQQQTDAVEPAGLRERKKVARRLALIDATHALVERDGLEGATVEAICAYAGVSTRTFFNYFESKDDAVLGIAPWALDPSVGDAFAAGGPTGRLMTDLEYVVTNLLDAPMIGRARIEAAMALARRDPRLLVRMMAWMEQNRGEVEALVRRRLGPDAPPHRLELVGILVMVIVRATFERRGGDGSGGADGGADDGAGAEAEVAAVVGELRDILAQT